MIIAWGIFIVSIIFVMITLLTLWNCLTNPKCKFWSFKEFLFFLIVALIAAQYIWGR